MEDSLLAEVQACSFLKQEESSKDSFKRLPDELIVSHILDKIPEAKSLCLISLVSRRFSSLVYQSQAISIKIALAWDRPAGIVLDFETSAKFLFKFRSIKSLYVELDYSSHLAGDSMDPQVVQWKIDSKSASFMILTAGSLQLATTDDGNEGGNSVDANLLWRFFHGYMKMVRWRFKFVKRLVRLLPESLQEVVVADSKREGNVHFGGRDIIEMRNTDSKFWDTEKNFKFWHAPFLKLPSSGCVMKTVTLFISKGTNRSDYDDLLIAKEAFHGEEYHQVYVEAVVEMMKRDSITQEFLQERDFLYRLILELE